MNVRSELPTAENSTNFNVVANSGTEVGTTLDNLKAAISGETGASATTIARVSKCLTYGSGGYAAALGVLGEARSEE